MARTIVALSLLLLAGTASADRTVEMIENSLEATLADVTMPSGAAGTVIVNRRCDGCSPHSLRASADTSYLLNGAQLPISEFAGQVDLIRQADGADDAFVGVYYNLETSFVTRITVTTGND